MVAVDTHIVVRLLAKDDPEQFAQAYQLFQSSDIYIPQTVALEIEWVLHFAYNFTPSQIALALTKLFGLTNVFAENDEVIARALKWHEKGLDFADALHLSNSQNCDTLYTFDRKFLNRSQNLGTCPVQEPQ